MVKLNSERRRVTSRLDAKRCMREYLYIRSKCALGVCQTEVQVDICIYFDVEENVWNIGWWVFICDMRVDDKETRISAQNI